MIAPLISVIIPAYNQAKYLGDAIQSVLDQTYKNFELIVVNDASPDNTGEVVERFTDPRIKYIVHEKNRHLAAARNTGIKASSGEIIALLDADDLFHSQKLEKHIEFLALHPEIGVSYNSRFEMDADGKVFALWTPSPTVALSDFVIGFPFAPSDMVFRREWIYKVDMFDESYVHFSEDLDIYCRLALNDCQMAGVKQALNYRRYYAGRIITQVSDRAKAALRALDAVFSDRRCTDEVIALKDQAVGKTYLIWAYEAFLGNQTDLGQEYIRKAFGIYPAYLHDNAAKLVEFIIMRSVQDEHDNEELIPRVFSQMPPEVKEMLPLEDKILANIYLMRCICELTWDHENMDESYFAKATRLGGRLDERLLHFLTFQMIGYAAEFGIDNTMKTFERVTRKLEPLGNKAYFRWMSGDFLLNKAYTDYHNNRYSAVPSYVLRAISNNPSYLINRGVIAVFVKSLINILRGRE